VSRPRSAFVALFLVLAVALTGCTISFSPPASPAPADPAAGPDGDTGAAERDPDQPTPDSEPESRQQDETAAVRVVDLYWQRHFTEVSRRAYGPPQVYGGYVGENGPPCGGQPSPPLNAFYCPDGDYLAWDVQLMDAGYEQIGDAWVYLVIFHEWGHAIQARLRPYQVDVAAELQADCFAGAALQGSIDDGELYLEPGDMQELSSTLVAVADDFPWSDSSSHGDAQERTSAFSAGSAGGPSACV
jgi:uncharacterized protein